MIIQIDIFNFKAHRVVRVPLSNYQLLVGPNGTGKSTVFDAILFVRNALVDGIESALGETMADSLDELTHCCRGDAIGFSFAFKNEDWPVLRYTTTFRQNESDGVVVENEAVTVLRYGNNINIPDSEPSNQLSFELFRGVPSESQVELLRKHTRMKSENWERIIFRTSTGADTFVRVGTEIPRNESYQIQTKVSSDKEFTLKYAPKSNGFEFANWIKSVMMNAPSRIQLDIEAIRVSGARGKSGETLSNNGDNFANVVYWFKKQDPEGFLRWHRHVKEYFPEIDRIDTESRPSEKRRIISAISPNGTRVPQYLLSDGTLRFMALTLLAYRQTRPKLLLIEEPENGLHPSAIEGVLAPFKTIEPDLQVIFASHSPIVLANFRRSDVLVFKKSVEGTELVRGIDHPILKGWAGDAEDASLLAAGII